MRRINDLRCARERRGEERGVGRRSVAVTVDCPVIQVRLTASRLRGRACGGSSSSPAYLRLCVKDTGEASAQRVCARLGHSSGHSNRKKQTL